MTTSGTTGLTCDEIQDVTATVTKTEEHYDEH